MVNCESKKSSKKQMDFSLFDEIKVLIKVGYFGWNYRGVQINDTNDGVENQMFETLIKVCLIESIEKCGFSRCGRTDKGVSSSTQLYSLTIKGLKKSVEEKDYDLYLKQILKAINHNLPDDIFIYSIAMLENDSEFDARFSCKSRSYKYFFLKKDLNILSMIDACKKFIGTHDFRNFCKVSIEKSNYVRTVHRCNIHLHDESRHIYRFEIESNGFLWHQIRFIMSILLMIGRELENSQIIDHLFDISKVPNKPYFEMADGLPLCLSEGKYDLSDVKWISDQNADEKINQKIDKEKESFLIKLCLIEEQKSKINICTGNEFIQSSESKLKHVPISKRKPMDLPSGMNFKNSKDGI